MELMLLNVTTFDNPVIFANAPPIYLIANGNTFICVNKDNKVEVKMISINTFIKKTLPPSGTKPPVTKLTPSYP